MSKRDKKHIADLKTKVVFERTHWHRSKYASPIIRQTHGGVGVGYNDWKLMIDVKLEAPVVVR